MPCSNSCSSLIYSCSVACVQVLLQHYSQLTVFDVQQCACSCCCIIVISAVHGCADSCMIIQIRMLVAQILNWFEVVEFELHICTCCTSISIIMVSVTMPLKYHSCVRCVSNTVRQCIWCLTFGHYSGLCLFVRYLGSADFSVGEFDWMSLCRTQRSALIVVLIALVMCLTVGLVSSMGFCASNDWSRRR